MARAWDVPGIGPGTRFREAAGRVVVTRWRELMSHRDAALRGDDPEGVHDMRVASRRLRTAMDAFEGAFPRRSYRPLVRRVKEIADTLGEVRDVDVAVERLTRELGEVAPDERPGVEGLIALWRDERAARAPRVAALIERLDAEGFSDRLESYVAEHTGVVAARLGLRPPGG